MTPTTPPTSTPPPPTESPAAGPSLDEDDVALYPAPLYAGDLATLDVTPYLPAGVTGTLTVTVSLPQGGTLTGEVRAQGFDDEPGARFVWAWDTSGLSGTQELSVTLVPSPEVEDPDPRDNSVTLPVELLPAGTAPERELAWMVEEVDGFRLHYLLGSAAHRDLPLLADEARSAYADVTTRLGGEAPPVDVYLLDRVIGQGGYASSRWVAISYADRTYAPAQLDLLLRHELVHRLDEALGCDATPAFLREGLAVYVAGGHYWPESLPLKASALLRTGEYVPLDELVDDFYVHQHEVGYLEAGAFVAYVVDRAGWDALSALCAVTAEAEGGEGERLSQGLQALELGELAAFEEEWLRWLRALRPSELTARSLEAEWHLMEALRAYQLRYDVGAHFLEGVLFSPYEGARRGIVADFARRPASAEAIAIELLLVMAQESLLVSDPGEAEGLLASVDVVLAQGFPAQGLAADVLAVVQRSLARGYEPYRLACEGDRCFVYALEGDGPVEEVLLVATLVREEWVIHGPQKEVQ